MMALFLTSHDVGMLLGIGDYVDVLKRDYKDLGVSNMLPRIKVDASQRSGFLKILPAALPEAGVAGIHAYTGGGQGDVLKVILLFDIQSSNLQAINEGVAVDAYLVHSVSHSISKEEIKKQREKREIPEGTIDKKGNPLKFSRDLESDWVVKNEISHYGLKEHASVDTNYGFVLATELTPASVSDSIYLPYCVAASCHTDEPIKKVYADKGYYGAPNRSFLSMNHIEDGVMRKDTKSTILTGYEKERNKQISKKRYIVEQYFGLSHVYNNAFRARFTRIIKNAIDDLFRQMAFNLFRGEKILGTV